MDRRRNSARILLHNGGLLLLPSEQQTIITKNTTTAANMVVPTSSFLRATTTNHHCGRVGKTTMAQRQRSQQSARVVVQVPFIFVVVVLLPLLFLALLAATVTPVAEGFSIQQRWYKDHYGRIRIIHASSSSFSLVRCAPTTIVPPAQFSQQHWRSVALAAASRNDDDDDDDDDGDGPQQQQQQQRQSPPMDLPGVESPVYDQRELLQGLTVAQLKQQLRLRGLTVSGRKSELMDRLLLLNNNNNNYSRDGDDEEEEENEQQPLEFEFRSAQQQQQQQQAAAAAAAAGKSRVVGSSSDARRFADEKGKELIDVTAYLDKDDVGQTTKSTASAPQDLDDDDDAAETNNNNNMQEVWGEQARLLVSEQYDDSDNDNNNSDGTRRRRLVVDSLSRTVVEFRGSNHTYVPAAIVATRDALLPYLSGGGGGGSGSSSSSSRNRTNGGDGGVPTRTTIAQATEQRLRELQWKREREAATPVRLDDNDGLDEDDETGIFANVLNREVSDWGKYTVTGAQLSAQEVPGVLLLADVYGAFSPDTTALAEKIAFECQPVIVMIPDLFRGNPWTGPLDGGVNAQGQSYDEWRAVVAQADLRVSVDIRAAAACLRETYGVSSVVVWGTCYGGGRALEAASGWCESVHDVDGTTIGPPPVEPMVAVVWYPTRYHDVRALFGKQHRGRNVSVVNGLKRKVAVMGVFAGNDETPGATPKDAATLKQLLEEDDRVVDHMVKVFPGQEHGFAHFGLGQPRQYSDDVERFVDEEFGGAGSLSIADGDAEVACLLSTAFMETYSRVFLPTVGPPISSDEQEKEWGRELTIRDLKETRNRNIREELNDAIDNFVEEPLMSGPRIDPTDDSQEEALAKLLRSMQDPEMNGPYKIGDEDDLPTIYKKLLSSDENFQIF